MKRRCRVVEVVVRPRADGGRASSEGRRNKYLLVEVQHVESDGDKVQVSKEEGLGWLEDGRIPHPNRWECGGLQQAKASRFA